jgi:hypothetical protein
MPIRSIAKNRQPDDRSYQQENHDELRIFNNESRHDTLLLIRRTLSIFARKITGDLPDKCEVPHKQSCLFPAGCVREGVSSLFTPPGFWRGFFMEMHSLPGAS